VKNVTTVVVKNVTVCGIHLTNKYILIIKCLPWKQFFSLFLTRPVVHVILSSLTSACNINVAKRILK
jgi:hypothetical protein